MDSKNPKTTKNPSEMKQPDRVDDTPAVPLRFARRFAELMQQTSFCVLFTFVLSGTVALGLAAIIQPAPRIHDEFSYLVAADGFSQLKTSAPTHPFWHHFESFHVIHEPRYASKYPPGQALSLSMGQLLGHPIIGSCFATAISLAAVMWMLIGWMPRKANLIVSLLLATHPGIQLVWGQSYMGGAVAMLGGALLSGAFIRLTRTFELKYSLLAATGVSLLAISRPCEGAVLTSCVLIALFYKLLSDSSWKIVPFLVRVVMPGGFVVAIAGLALASYNASVTGQMTKMPYQVHEATYGWNPLFLWQTPSRQMPEYRHRVIERFHSHDVNQTRQDYSSLAGFLKEKTKSTRALSRFFLGCSLFFGLVGIPFALKRSQYRLALTLLLPALAAGYLTPWGYAHYVAPIAPLILLLVFGGIVEIWEWRLKFPFVGKFALAFVLLHGIWLVSDTTDFIQAHSHAWHVDRASLEARLRELPGNDLVFVSYDDEQHNFNEEWVYNKMDIDGAEVVWAREMSPQEDEELIRYFGDRCVWIVKPDEDSRTLIGYGHSEHGISVRVSP